MVLRETNYNEQRTNKNTSKNNIGMFEYLIIKINSFPILRHHQIELCEYFTNYFNN